MYRPRPDATSGSDRRRLDAAPWCRPHADARAGHPTRAVWRPADRVRGRNPGNAEAGPRTGPRVRDGAGVNYNNVWAALGRPVDVVAARRKAGEAENFHVGGSDASGIVWAVGEGVDSVRVGDHVVAHCGVWDPADPWIMGAAIRSSRPARASGDTRPTGELRAVHARPAASTPPQIFRPQLGGCGGMHAGRCHRVPHALLVASARSCRE